MPTGFVCVPLSVTFPTVETFTHALPLKCSRYAFVTRQAPPMHVTLHRSTYEPVSLTSGSVALKKLVLSRPSR